IDNQGVGMTRILDCEAQGARTQPQRGPDLVSGRVGYPEPGIADDLPITRCDERNAVGSVLTRLETAGIGHLETQRGPALAGPWARFGAEKTPPGAGLKRYSELRIPCQARSSQSPAGAAAPPPPAGAPALDSKSVVRIKAVHNRLERRMSPSLDSTRYAELFRPLYTSKARRRQRRATRYFTSSAPRVDAMRATAYPSPGMMSPNEYSGPDPRPTHWNAAASIA